MKTRLEDWFGKSATNHFLSVTTPHRSIVSFGQTWLSTCKKKSDLTFFFENQLLLTSGVFFFNEKYMG